MNEPDPSGLLTERARAHSLLMALRVPLYALAGAVFGYLAFHVHPLWALAPVLLLVVLERVPSSDVCRKGDH